MRRRRPIARWKHRAEKFRRFGPAFAVLAALSSGAALAQEQGYDSFSFEHLVRFQGVSGDGSLILGQRPDGFFVRSRAGAETFVPFAGGVRTDLSADGTTVVGYAFHAREPDRPFRWTRGDGFTWLRPVQGGDARAWATNRNGEIVVGDSTHSIFGFSSRRATRWILDDGQYLPLLNGRSFSSTAYDVSDDGLVVVGVDAGRGDEAVRWTGTAGHITGLGHLPGGGLSSEARGVSGDGRVVVGHSDYGAGSDTQAFRWTETTGMVGLGFLAGGGSSSASQANRDGSVIYGTGETDLPGGRVYRWTENGGMVSMISLLAAGGVDVTDVRLWDVTGTSDDGNVVVGWGYEAAYEDSYGWIARCSDLCQALVPAQALAASLSGLSAMSRTSTMHMEASLDLMGDAMDGAIASRATRRGPFTVFGYGLHDTDPILSAQVGFTYDLPAALTAGVMIGASRLDADLAYGGSARFDAGHVAAFLGQGGERGPTWMLAAHASRLSGDIERAYVNGAAVAASHGETDGYTLGGLARLGWTFGTPAPKLSLTPYGSLSYGVAGFDGWTETTGPFPLSIGGFSQEGGVARLGLDARYVFGPEMRASAGLAWAHRYGEDDAPITASFGNAFATSAPALAPADDWFELTAGLSLPVANRLTASVSAAASVPLSGETTWRTWIGLTKAF